MGLVLDSSPVIRGERLGLPPSDFLADIYRRYGRHDVVLSAISVAELEHGIYRAQTSAVARSRQLYLAELFAIVSVEPFTRNTGSIVARVDAESRKRGLVIPYSDLLIGGTAIELGYELVTCNVRHFQLIPDLVVHAY